MPDLKAVEQNDSPNCFDSPTTLRESASLGAGCTDTDWNPVDIEREGRTSSCWCKSLALETRRRTVVPLDPVAALFLLIVLTRRAAQRPHHFPGASHALQHACHFS